MKLIAQPSQQATTAAQKQLCKLEKNGDDSEEKKSEKRRRRITPNTTLIDNIKNNTAVFSRDAQIKLYKADGKLGIFVQGKILKWK